ncbi:Serine/threonine-protein kinase PknB [Novipirellula galeiformis]|uniref:Serine/threonine-protein kinase PknB n=2 Tax=Novipirellula galeiformis TaxID=2528004 RepID=A0A5C6CLG3_9BACT|nr:Serine/threonine-protein kinase PknB [Novipirellula galeiformis]
MRGASVRMTRRGGLYGLTLLAIVAMLWVPLNFAVRTSVHEMARQSLRWILNANVAAFERWNQQRESDVVGAMANPKRQSIAERILASQHRHQPLSPEPLESGSNPAAFTKLLAEDSLPDDVLGWALIDVDGRVWCTNLESLLAETLRIPSDALDKTISRQTTITRPFRAPIALSKTGPMSLPTPPVIAAMTPITQGAKTLGCFIYLIDPHDEFSSLFSAASANNVAESFAIDRRGVMLTDSANLPVRKRSGASDGEASAPSILNLKIQNPVAGDGTENHGEPPRPFTLLADQLTRGGMGENVDGYRNHWGVDVIGAWRWLPEYGVGIGVEMSVADAYAPLGILSMIHWALAILMAAAVASLVGLQWLGPRLSQSPGHPLPVRQLGQYQLGRLLGEGAMGAVYLGSHAMLKRNVAIKVLEKEELTSTTASRFAREVRLTAQLRHPNTIAIFDYGRSNDGTFFYVMEYIDGITLQQLIDQEGRQNAGRVISILIQMCGSLSEAHDRGIVHRDIKPANIILAEVSGVGDMIKVLDFGLVKEIVHDSVELTQVDSITGTPMYMSPEAVRDASTADERSDVYAVGAVGYALLTGVPLFERGGAVDICLKQLNETPLRPADRVGVPFAEDLQNVLMSCLQKDANQRPLSMDQLADTLRACEDHGRWAHVDSIHWWKHYLERRQELQGTESQAPSDSDLSDETTKHHTREFSG